MKRVLKTLALAAVAMTMLFTSCQKEKVTPTEGGTTPPAIPVFETIEGTEWEGTFYTTTQTQYGLYPVTIHWTVDFLSNGEGEVMMWQESQAYDPDKYTWKMTYTYEGNNAGVITDGFGEWPVEGDNQYPFTLDAVNRTLEVMLQFEVQHVADGPIITYGGLTTLHQIR